MALFNYANREITAKIVYYGPGVCGKTTSLQYIHERIAPEQRGRLLSLATETDRTIFFDLLPLKLGEIRGFKLRFQLYTVPGQVKYNKTRKLVLQGADAVVFVADSRINCREGNIESFRNLQENLKEQGKKIEDLPMVFEFNKRDLKDLLTMDQLNQDLNVRKLPFFSTVATQGVGVMETLEAISKMALRDIEHRLSANATAESAPQEPEEDVDALLDLTAGEELVDDSLSFSSNELDSLQLESEAEDEDKTLESRPIGYDTSVQIEEFEIHADAAVAQTGTLKESEFFALKDVEEQALRELDEFIQGKVATEDDSFSFEAYNREIETEAAGDEELFSLDAPAAEMESENVVDFSFDTALETGASAGASDLDFSFDTGGIGVSATEEEEEPPDTEEFHTSQEAPPAESLLEFSWDEETHDSGKSAATRPKTGRSDLEPLALSADELDLTVGEEENSEEELFPAFNLPEDDARGESTSLSDEADELMEFTIDEEPSSSLVSTPGSQKSTAQSDIQSLNLSESDLDNLSFGDEESEETPLITGLDASAESPSEPYDFRITDSVRFEMQHSEEISSVTPFEKHLDMLSEDMFTAEEEPPRAEFQPESSEAGPPAEQFQSLADESKRMIAVAKYLHRQGDVIREKQTVGSQIQAALMYYMAVETGLKAVALKYETCNPAIASLNIILNSIEEETGKTISGKKSMIDNIVKVRDQLQLETGYPDQDASELGSRICERFLSSLAQEFLSIDFAGIAPLLPEPSKNS